MSRHPCNVVATIRLLASTEGGRRGPASAHQFGCLMQIGGVNLDTRLWLDDVGPLSPGQEARVRMGFLNPELAEGYCSAGQPFALWEGRKIGEGVIPETAFPKRNSAERVVRTA